MAGRRTGGGGTRRRGSVVRATAPGRGGGGASARGRGGGGKGRAARGGGACRPRSSASPRRPYSSGTGRPAGRPREEYAMSRLEHVTDTGGRRGLRLLLMLRHDLLTLR